jgi:hypothetical protein
MEFLSPLTLLKEFIGPIEKGQEINFNKVKKKLLAEFDLSDDGVLEINGKTLNKSEALQLLEDLKSDNKLDIYLELADYPELEAFMENEDTSFLENQNTFIANASRELRDYVEPIFAAKYSDVLKSAIRSKKYLKVKNLTKHPMMLGSDFETRCFNPSHNYLNGHIGELEQLQSEFKYDNDQFFRASFLWSTEFITILNTLPSYFHDIRDHIGEHLQKLAVKLLKEFDNGRMADRVISGAVKLDTSSAIKMESKRLQGAIAAS